MKALAGQSSRARDRGSALILTVVLTSLLAIVGVLFLMAARLDRMATSATSANRELQLAVETVIAQIGEELVADVPTVDPNQEYYDYPDEFNKWLADLEPDLVPGSSGRYYWPQISNIQGTLTGRTTDVPIEVLGDRDAGVVLARAGADPNADADGDGISDARWYQVPGILSGKGRPVYAAVRVIDNGGMLNVNTGYKFDPCDTTGVGVDGTRQLQINAVAFGKLSPGPEALLEARAYDVNHPDVYNLRAYERDVIWRFAEPLGIYTPFDLSDELELRYRYLLDHQDIDTRAEHWGLFRRAKRTPYAFDPDPSRRETDVNDWLRRATLGYSDPNAYAFRHIATTYNMDRAITPKPFSARNDPNRVYNTPVNVNSALFEPVLAAVAAALDVDPNTNLEAMQIAANLVDYIDDDSVITCPDLVESGLRAIYGFERPCIYISELAYNYTVDAGGNPHRSYGIELYKPYFEDDDPSNGQWRLTVGGRRSIDVGRWYDKIGSRRFHVVASEDPNAELDVSFVDPEQPSGFSDYRGEAQADPNLSFAAGDRISLQRQEPRYANLWLTVDEVEVPGDWMDDVNGVARSIERDIMPHHCVLRFWNDVNAVASTLGARNAYQYMGPALNTTVQAHPADKPLTNIGEIGRVFAKGLYCLNGQDPYELGLAGYTPAEDNERIAADVLIDLAKPRYARLLNYLTVPINPFASQSAVSPTETRVKGRVNINTAPAFVIAQLPWLKRPWLVDPNGGRNEDFAIPEEIVNYRNERGPFRSIADLMQVYGTDSLGNQIWPMQELAFDDRDNQYTDTPRGPDLSPDVARDDMEERDLLFTRISNLVTVRSDVYTAYILVRLGADGPQKRVVAILDRSGVSSSGDRARIVALHSVPDPR